MPLPGKLASGMISLDQQIFFPYFLISSQFIDASLITDLPVIDDIAAVT
jgi:hypothetical protein